MADVNASLVKALDGTAPQYKRRGAQAFDAVEGSDGALYTKLLGTDGEEVDETNPLSVSLTQNSIEVVSESDMPLNSGESYTTVFKHAKGNRIQLAISTSSANVSDNLRVIIRHYNATTSGNVYSETLEYKQGMNGRLFEADLVGKYYQISITNTTDSDAIVNRLYLKEIVGFGNSESTLKGIERQVMERGREVYDHNTISLSNREIIFSTLDSFELDHLYYVYKPSNPLNVNPENSHAPLLELRVNGSWVAYTGIATYGSGSTNGRINPYPAAIAGHINNSHFPQYNILQYDIKNGVYAFEVKDIVAPEGFQFSVYMPGSQEEGETSELCYQLRGRIK